nr:BTAD domain-containing putative transcriptional regulator [Mycobacterium sp. 1164966.3]
MELGVLGPLQVRQDGAPVAIPGAKPRALLTMLGLHSGSVVSADHLVELLWGDDPPRTAAKALQTHISSLRRTLGDGFVLTAGAGWALAESEVDASRYRTAARLGRAAAAAGDPGQAVTRFEEALALWRGIPELPDSRRGTSEKTQWIEGHAALVEDRADALLSTGRAAEIIGELEAAVADAPLRERRWGQLMLALYRAGRQGEALGAYQRARTLLAEELGVDPGPYLRRLEAAIVAQDAALEIPAAQQPSTVTRAVTFLLTDIEGSTAAWEADADAMATALARHDELVEQVVTSRGGRLIKTRGEGDATFSVFDRPSTAAAAAIELQEAIVHEPWALREPMRIRVALHTGEVELRDGDYFGRAVNRAARLRSLAEGGQILCSGATAELVIDSLPDDVELADLGMRQLKNLARPEHVFELRLATAEVAPPAPTNDAPIDRPALPAVLGGPGPFVGRGPELEGLFSAWQRALAGGTNAVLIAGEPGVGKTRLAGEWSRQAYDQGALVIYGRCDEDLGAPYQPFAEALRSLVPCLGANRLRGLRGVEALLALVPGLTDVLPDLAAPTRADPDTERYALFDAVVALLGIASARAPVVLILDDLHWAAKPTLLLLRHLLRFGERDRVQIVGTYRSTDLDRSHPLAAMLADLHRDGTAKRIALGGLDEDDVTAYVAEAGFDDEELARALASVTGGNPFFLIEALRHVDESGGHWDPSTLPQGVREAVSRRLTRLPAETNKALAAAAVVGSRFGLELVERVVGDDLVDAFDEACKAGIVIEESSGHYRFNHALVRQSLLAELPSVRRLRLHQRIATTLETEPGADDELLGELAYHYFECAWAGNAAKAVEYCRRAADQAMARLAYEGAADLYDRALHALEEIDDELPDRDDQVAALMIARCEALLAAGDVTSAAGAVAQLQDATRDSARLAAWATCFDGQLSMLIHPERLDEVEAAVGAAAGKLAELDDAAGEAMAHTVRAGCLARLGRIGDCEIALDDALTAARRAREHRRVNAVLAGAPLAALWGPNPVPRAGGRCLDVVRLLRITTDSPAVEATSTRCQAVLEAFRGRAEAARRMIESARRTVTELGLRHAFLEVQQFAGIVELVVGDPAAAEPHLRQAYNGFRRMGLDADTAETAALLGRTCLALDHADEADELCRESERLAGHALKPSIEWRSLRAHLLSRGNDHDGARRAAEAAVALAERTDLLVDHGDACASLATVLGAAGDARGARAAAERAVGLYEQKGAAALAEMARNILGAAKPAAPAPPEPEPQVEPDTACVRAIGRLDAAFERGAWDAELELLAPVITHESRRKIVGYPRVDLPASEWVRMGQRAREVGPMRHHHVVIAVRGERLALCQLDIGTADVSRAAPQDEMLEIIGLDKDGRIALQVFFDLEDSDAAVAELDAAHSRRIAQAPQEDPSVELDNACVRVIRESESAANRDAWDEMETIYASDVFFESRRKIIGFTRDDLPPGAWVDHARRLRDSGGLRARIGIIAIRGERLALTRLELFTEDDSLGAPHDEALQLYGIDNEGRISLQVVFDIEDVDAALAELDAAHARFEETPSNAPRLENAASRADGRFNVLFAERRWDEIGAMLIDHIQVEDRRRGLRREGNDRATELAELRAIAEVGTKTMSSVVLAIRGERLALVRTLYSGQDKRPGAFCTELLRVAEIDTDERIVAYVAFDLDDVDAAYEELEARYLAGEAAPYADVWQIGMETLGELNRHEPGPMIARLVYTDHRHIGFASGDFGRAVEELWALVPDARYRTTAVHALDAHGTVVKFVIEGTDIHGNELQWPRVLLMYVGRGETRLEVYEEDDVDAALARFKELRPQAPRLENAASQAVERYQVYFASRDWDAFAAILADNVCIDDRRRLVNAGVRHGRKAESANMRAAADAGFTYITSVFIAARGNRLTLTRGSGGEGGSGEFLNEMLSVVEVNSHNQIAAIVLFDLDDFDAAVAELDARYIAGEAAAHPNTWSVIAGSYAAINRNEQPAISPDWVTVDHRRETAMGPGDLIEYIEVAPDPNQDNRSYVEAVQRLDDLGAVITYAAHETSQEGLTAEWRGIAVFTVEGEMINRTEVFDEQDADTAIARFDELSRPAPQLQNRASQISDRFLAYFAARDWDAMAAMTADDFSSDDRRCVVGAGIQLGRDADVDNMRAWADVGVRKMTFAVIAVRGEHLFLGRTRFLGAEQGSDAFHSEVLGIVEVDAKNRIVARVVFDPDDFEAAIAELDARYIAGEAAPYASVWKRTLDIICELNRHELGPTIEQLAYVDHRRVPFADGDFRRAIEELLRLVPDARYRTTKVHALDAHGTVVKFVIEGTDIRGNELQWPRTLLLYVGRGETRLEVYEEEDVDAALARFEELRPPVRRLENAASQAYEHILACIAPRDWDAMTETVAEDFYTEDRRRVVNAGIRHGRNAAIEEVRAAVDVGLTITMVGVMATRGERLALVRVRATGPDPGASQSDAPTLVELRSDGRIAATVIFDLDDFDSALEELDARYLAAEAAAHAHPWSVIARMYSGVNRGELPATTQDWVNLDHRHVVTLAPGDIIPNLRAFWDLMPDRSIYIEAVHRLSDLGAVLTFTAKATSQEGFEGEWRANHVVTIDGDLVSRSEMFDEADIDAALAKFDQLSRPAPRLENRASRITERLQACIVTRDWAAAAEMLADDVLSEDRRRVVNAGIRRSRDAAIEDARAIANLGVTDIAPTILATRGERLVLRRARCWVGTFYTDILDVYEIGCDDRVVGLVVFDPDDFEAALAELDARYLAGESAAHAHTWSLVTGAFAAINRHELPELTPDWANVDHRRGAAFAPGDMTAFVRDIFEDSPDIEVYIEAVHRLANLGVVVTQRAHGISQNGFEAEWREIGIFTFDGELLSRCELFDEMDLDAAIARFDQLSQPASRLENAASQAIERFHICFEARDWDAMAELMAEEILDDDRRRVVNAGVRRGRDAEIANMQAIADIGAQKLSSTVIATRGERLVLRRENVGNDELPEAFQFTSVLQIVEIDADERLAAVVTFDLDQIDAAFEELDGRYLAEEAAEHAHTWSVITRWYAALNRHEIPPTTPDWVNTDHRRGRSFEAGDLPAFLHATWELMPQARIYIEAVHRLSNFGALVTQASQGTSPDGFDAEWREISMKVLDGDLISRSELFDETDIELAITRFDELQPSAPQLENVATQVAQRFWSSFAARDWHGMAEILADDLATEDRRRVVGAGSHRGRDFDIANMRAVADIGVTNATLTVIATRGVRLALSRIRLSGRDQRPDAFHTEALGIAEIDTEGRLVTHVAFDPEDFDGAFAELDARYLAGEAAPHSHIWSALTRVYRTINRHELTLTTPDWVNIDHRRGRGFAPGDMTANILAAWQLTPDIGFYFEAVHRLSNLGAVVTSATHGTSDQGFDAEWHQIDILMFEGGRICRCEIFDEADLDAALARFEELHPQSPRLKNAVVERFLAHFAARDWDAMAQDFADTYYLDDHRRVVNAGVRNGRDAAIEDMRAAADVGLWANITADVIATRGSRLFLSRFRSSGRDHDAVQLDVLQVAEIDADERFAACIVFDLDDIDAALEELDARYLAGEAAPCARTWSLVRDGYAALNRRELPPATSDLANIDHRRLVAIEARDFVASLRAAWDLTSQLRFFIERVHRLTNLGAVVTQAVSATSQEGFDGEWREIALLAFDGDLIKRCEIFDETDLDAALARFDELHPQAPRLENTATQIIERYQACFTTRGWAAMAELLANDIVTDDRRRVVNAGVRRGREVHIADMRATVDVSDPTFSTSIIASRGERLALARVRIFNRGMTDEVGAEALGICEIDADERIVAMVSFDPDDIDAAFKELDARYLAGEAAQHAHTWSAITGLYAAINRHEIPAMTPNSVYIDHRPLISIEALDMAAFFRAVWELTPQLSMYVEAVQRLNNLGAVVSVVARGTSEEGSDVEWRPIGILMFEGNQLGRCETFAEVDIDLALARFDELRPQAPRLENAASRVAARVWSGFAARDWDALTELFIDNISTDDRRRVVNAGVRQGREVVIDDMRRLTEFAVNITSTVIATRGERLALNRIGTSTSDNFDVELLSIIEIGSDNRVVAGVQLDIEDVDAAFAELDARYITGEAAPHAQTWTAIARTFATINRHELPTMTPNSVFIDRRPLISTEAIDGATLLRAALELTPQVRMYVEAVHRLDNLGAVVSVVARGTSEEGFDVEWRPIDILMFEGDRLSRCEVFDEADIGAALARFDELHPQEPRLGNAASRAEQRFFACWAARNWAAMAETLTEDTFIDDTHRNVANVGLWDGRDVVIANMQTLVDDAAPEITTLTVVATRGERLVLTHRRSPNRDPHNGEFVSEGLIIAETDNDGRITAHIQFDVDDIDAAFAELDARYLVGEAAAYSHTWSLMAQTHSALNRHEIPPTAPGFVNIDHRRGIAFAPGDIVPFVRATFDDTPDATHYIVAVHRLSDLGAVITQALRGTSRQGLDAEWQNIGLFTFEGDLATRVEVFDEEDLDAAITRFKELHQRRRLENTASRVNERMYAYFAADDWAAIAEIFANDIVYDDRRRVVNGGCWHGRNLVVENMRAVTDFTVENLGLVATRGDRLALSRWRWSNSDPASETFHTEVLCLVEVDTDALIAGLIVFDPESFDPAIAELDARYLAGEAAGHAHTWSVIARGVAAINRRELPAVTADCISIDHRRGTAFETGDLTAAIYASFDVTPRLRIHTDAVHRLNDLGAVVTNTAYGTSQEGFDAEWRMIQLLTIDGESINRHEVFDEADLDAALARFEELQPPPPRLESAASRITEYCCACFSAQDWATLATLLADDMVLDDRRRVVNAGVRRGRDSYIADNRAAVEAGAETISSSVIATRGERLALAHVRAFNRGFSPGEVGAEWLVVAEIDAGERIAAIVAFDLDDIDTAFEELDARYFTGEAAAHSRTWSVIARAQAAFNRHELPTADWVTIDHRPVAPIDASDLQAAIRAIGDLTPDLTARIEAVHRLSSFGAVVTYTAHGISTEGFAAEWRMIEILTVDGDRLNRSEFFDEADLDAALARFEELQPQAPLPENAAGRIFQRYYACFSIQDWAAMSELLADDIVVDDRRRVVNAGVRHGRDVHIADNRAAAEVGGESISSSIIATRGERLALAYGRVFNSVSSPGEVAAEWLAVAEIYDDERIVAMVGFDLDDIDAAYEELDARYLAGEAAAHLQTWSVIARECAAFNRHEHTIADFITIDHRPLAIIDAADPQSAMRTFDVTPDFSIRIEAVHRLSGFGAVATYTAHGTSPDGFAGEWRMIFLLTVEGERINRCDVFDEADLDAALALFEELQPPTRRLENAATQVAERLRANFTARDWTAYAELLAEDCFTDDRRRVVNAGNQHGRDADIANMRAIAAVGVANIALTTIAIRGERLALGRARMSGRDQRPEAFYTETLTIVEIDTNNRVVAQVVFDPDDIDAAFEQLDARYLAGEAAAHAHVWSVIAGIYAGFNRREPPATTPDWVYVDHRPLVRIDAVDLPSSIDAVWEQTPDIRLYIEAVHRVSDLGAVVTHTARGISQENFDAEWRMVDVLAVEGDLMRRSEMYDEADLDAALARFEELQPRAPRLENAASQVDQRFWKTFTARDWDGMAELLADDVSTDDRRRVVNAGVRQGRDHYMATMRAAADVGFEKTASTVLATRGVNLALTRVRAWADGMRPEEAGIDVLNIAEIDADNRIVAHIGFDLDDIDAAFAELDVRYLSGEAAPHAQTWSVIAESAAAFNRREFPPITQDSVYIDHRPLLNNAASDLAANSRATWDLMPDIRVRIEAVHRVSELGAVITQCLKGASQEGLDAEWRMIAIFTVDGDLIDRAEMFDEADLDTALARFDELQPQAPRLVNAASQVDQRFWDYFTARNWDAMAELMAEDISTDDHRRVVNSGIRHGRVEHKAGLRAAAEVGTEKMASIGVIATRGARLALTRIRSWNRGLRPEEVGFEALTIVEIDSEGRIVARVGFDVDDIDAAFADLEARYIAGEGAAHSRTWSVIAGTYAAYNHHELPLTTTDSVYIDHRPLVTIEASDLATSIRVVWDLLPDISYCVETVHRLSELGAVVTQTLKGTSKEGVDVEWRMIDLFTIEGDLISCCEIFDETDLDAALARFDELSRQLPRLENAATRAWSQLADAFNRRDLDGVLAAGGADAGYEDRRKGLGDKVDGSGRRKAVLAVFEMAQSNWRMEVEPIAIRGTRLAVIRGCYRDVEDADRPIAVEFLNVMELGDDGRMEASVSFDPDDIDAAFAELDARYLAGEAGPHAHIWSVIARNTAALNRHELPSADWVVTDHRRGTPFAPRRGGDTNWTASTRGIWDITPHLNIHIEAVHRLSNLGAVVTWVGRGISQDGFEAEWRMIQALTVEGDLVNRCELFDEADLDAALARFEELQPQARQLENAAGRVSRHLLAHFAAGDWHAMAEMLADDFFRDDRRRVVGAGVGHGRDGWISDMRATADLWTANVTSTVIATRGERLVLIRGRFSHRDQAPEGFVTEYLSIVEINADEQIAAIVMIDLNDIDAAFEELDARYLAGEAAPHARIWSAITDVYAKLNRHELLPTTHDWVNIDHHRLVRAESGQLTAYAVEAWNISPDMTGYIEAVHRMSNFGTVVTLVVHGTSQEGFDAEWREIELLMFDGDRINRLEIFDEEDVDAALARFDELQPQARRLENAASQAYERFWSYYTAHDWDAMGGMLVEDLFKSDRRRVVNAGIQHGREIQIADMRSLADIEANNTVAVVATRGKRLVLTRVCSSNSDLRHGEFGVEMLAIVEIAADERIAAFITFDLDDIDAAFEELDSRYLAGEAAAHADTWSVIAEAYAGFNRHELPPMATDSVSVDRRRLVTNEAVDLAVGARSVWAVAPDVRVHIEAVHRLSQFGAVVTHVGNGASPDGLDADWRMVNVFTVDGDLLSRCEIFDEVDLDAALARFDELHPRAPRPTNAASQVEQHFLAYFGARDWNALAELIANDISVDDRRRVVNAGVLHGRNSEIASLRALASVGVTSGTSTVVAIRGERLVLGRNDVTDRWSTDGGSKSEALCVVEINSENQIVARVVFDSDDLDAAFEELDARYVAGEAATNSDTWSVITKVFASMSRRELPPTTPDWVNVDHRRLAITEAGGLEAALRSLWELMPELNFRIEAVHRLSDLGAVFTRVATGTSQDGLDAEWRCTELMSVGGNLLSRAEVFDEDDLDAALARFDELHLQTPRPENAASQVEQHFWDHFAAHDWDAMAELLSDEILMDDRRRVVRAGLWYGREAVITNMRAVSEAGLRITVTVVATRGERLALYRAVNRDVRHDEFYTEMFSIVEIDADNKIKAHIAFDVDNIDAAVEELDARYLAGEAAAFAQTWTAMTQVQSTYNRHELSRPVAEDCVSIDHRRGRAFAPGDLIPFLSATWEVAPDVKGHIEAVHRLSTLGVVITEVMTGTSEEGFDAEWREIGLFLFEGELVSRFELFDEEDLDAALARFDELNGQVPPLENAAAQT